MQPFFGDLASGVGNDHVNGILLLKLGRILDGNRQAVERSGAGFPENDFTRGRRYSRTLTGPRHRKDHEARKHCAENQGGSQKTFGTSN